jgi:SIT family siderophore-iron:H+ symporter-like MFS transporter
MFAIIYPICAIPLLAVLFTVQRRSKKAGALESYKSSFETLGGKKMAVELFWHLDVVGLILMIAMLACILVPFTLAGGVTTQWKTAKVIAPLVIGFLLIPVWVYWEKTCKHPMIPFKVSCLKPGCLIVTNSLPSFFKIVLSGVLLESLSCSTPVCLPTSFVLPL